MVHRTGHLKATLLKCLGKYSLQYLQSILEELVHPGHLGRNAEVDGTLTDLDDETTPDVWVDLEYMSAVCISKP